MFKKFGRKRKGNPLRAGCGFLLLNGIFLVSLFLINNLLVKLLFSLRSEEADERLLQAGQLLMPLGLLFLQLWIIDWLRGSSD